MNTKLIFAAISAVAMLAPVTSAVAPAADELDFPLAYLLPAGFGCENGSHTTSFPDPTVPGTIMSIDILCPDPNPAVALDSHYGTDCPGDSWSHWQGPIASAWSYTFDTTNPFGFSQATVNAGWDSSNKIYEAQVASNIYNGFVNGGTNVDSGVYDSYVLAEFRLLGGQLRNAVAVQWAWTSGGKIVHTDAAYNTKYAMADGAVPNKYDFQSISAHEMGHGYGLGHSDTSTASKCLTLYPYATLNAAHGRTLGDGDIHSIKVRGY